MRYADCHLDRKHYAHRLCKPCYHQTPKYKAYQREYCQTSKYKTINLNRQQTIEYREYQKRYQQTPGRKEHTRKYQRERRRDPLNRLINNMRIGMYKVLSGKRKSAHTFKYVGCSPTDLMKHIENQFQSGMLWKNYGEWHVDHIRPLALLKECTEKDLEPMLYELWNYKNLQPLWARDNLSKRDSI